MSKKITKEEFLHRFYENYPNADINIIEYTAISKPCTVRCNKCSKVFSKPVARKFILNYECCGSKNESEMDRIKRKLNGQQDFELVKKIDFQYVIMKHNKCGSEMKRAICSVLDNPFSCKYCETHKKLNILSIQEVQKQIDSSFDNIVLLEYHGQLNKNKYRCTKCGLIFEQVQTNLMKSRGCPKCDRWKSKGEKMISRYLEERKINFKEQVGVPELPLQHFDFGIYDDKDNLIGFIEVQGEQHFVTRYHFDPVEVQQERDNRKRKYCKEYNIPLYELIYIKGKILNLDILPF